jgi:hypothetical protein
VFPVKQHTLRNLHEMMLVISASFPPNLYLNHIFNNILQYGCTPFRVSEWPMSHNLKKKFWEELIASFPLIRHGPHRQRLQQFFVAPGTSLPSCYLATIGKYTDRPTDSPLIRHGPHRKCIQQLFYCCMHSMMRERVYQTVSWQH